MARRRLLGEESSASAKLVRMEQYNPQSQPHYTFPAAFPVVRSYLDQLMRNNGLSSDRTTAIAKALDAAEQQSNGGAATTGQTYVWHPVTRITPGRDLHPPKE